MRHLHYILLLYFILPILINGFAGFDFARSATTTIDKYVGRSSYAKIKEIWNYVMNFRNSTMPNSTEIVLRQLPEVIVLGSETTGKSTLLAAITGRNFFPTDSKVCTRFPIQFSLRNGETRAELKWKGEKFKYTEQKFPQLEAKIAKIMKETTEYSENVLDIVLYGKDLPEFTLIDLPGLISKHAKDAATVEKIADSFIKNDTLILLVVPASLRALRTDHAYDKVLQQKKQNQTIVCLTQLDTVNTNNNETIQDLLIDKILNKNKDFDHFFGVVATAHLNKLQQFPNKEIEFFNSIIQQHPHLSIHQKQLENSLSSQKVIGHLDRLFHNYMNETWCPEVNKEIIDQLFSLQASLDKLGIPPDQMKVQDVWNELWQEWDYAKFLTVMQSKITESTMNKLKQSVDLKKINAVTNQMGVIEYNPMTPEKMEVLDQLNDFFTSLQEKVPFHHANLQTLVQSDINKIFEEQKNQSLMIKRYDNFKNLVLQLLDTEFRGAEQRDIPLIKSQIVKIQSHFLATSNYNSTLQMLLTSQENILGLSFQQIIKHRLPSLLKIIKNNSSALIENNSTQLERNRLMHEIEYRHHQQDQTNHLQEFLANIVPVPMDIHLPSPRIASDLEVYEVNSF